MKSLILLVCCIASAAVAFPRPYPMADEGYGPPVVAAPYAPAPVPYASAPAPSYGGDVGRVKIQVYRGPNEKDCDPYDYYCNEFAPWGYYNTQPADKPRATYH